MSTASATPKRPSASAGQPNPRRPSANPAVTTAPSTSASSAVNTSTPNRSPSRMAPQAGAVTTNAATTVNRARSVRTGAPVSARAAARKPAALDGDTTIEDVRAEMQARLDDVNERLQQAESACDASHKQAAMLQAKLDETITDHSTLEEQVHEQAERIEELEHERKESLRARREMEQIYEAERVAAMREKEETLTREEEMQHALQRMKETLAQREMRAGLDDDRRPNVSRASSFRSNTNNPSSPNLDGAVAATGQFAPPSSLQRSDSRSSSKLVMQKDKIIEGLRLELAEAQIKLVEVDNMGGSRMHELQKQMMEIKVQNARLMEENESFQLLLSEKTLNGDLFAAGVGAMGGPSLRTHAPSIASGSRPPSSRVPNDQLQSTSLADELDDASSFIETTGTSSTANDELSKRLQVEVNGLKDSNKALTLYINNIISRLLQHEQFEQILDKTPDIMSGPPPTGTSTSTRAATAASSVNTSAAARKLMPLPSPQADVDKELPRIPTPLAEQQQAAASTPPPPPPATEDTQQPAAPTGFLQRAKSVMGGTRPKRPTSMALPPQQPQTDSQPHLFSPPLPPEDSSIAAAYSRLTENPATAPTIPLSRSKSSSRNSSSHRRANSEWPAASLVTNMYRGPGQTPGSPGVTSPIGVGARNSFFGGGGGVVGLGARVPSSGSAGVPTYGSVAEEERRGANQDNVDVNASANRDSKLPPQRPRSTEVSATDGELSNPSSPPRSTTSSGERERDGGKPVGGAIMMGSRMRPLRLVQDAAAQDGGGRAGAGGAAGNRGSWFGWMNNGKVGGAGVGASGGAVGRSVSGDAGQTAS